MNRLRHVAEFIATVAYAGRFPFASGTVGSLIAVVIWWYLISGKGVFTTIVIILITTIAAVWSAHYAEKKLGHDAHPIIIDEVVGQWIALIACPRTILSALVAFLLFRLFDIWKPFPIYQSQQLPGGFGIVVDDILAGGSALLVLTIIYQFWFR